MKKITKILNHNAIIVHDKLDNQTLLIMHKGVGFNRKINEMITLGDVEMIYHVQTSANNSKHDALLNKLDPIYLEISNDILTLYQNRFSTLDEQKLLPLADHIAFAIQRMKHNIVINNPFSNEIRLLYPQEWEVAARSREIIFNKLGCLINDDEIGYITLHLHSTQEISKDDGFIVAMVVNQSIREIEKEYEIVVNTHSLSYSRLMMHMKYMIARLNEDEVLTLDMEDYTRSSIPTAYSLAAEIVDRMAQALSKEVPTIEVGYLAMHMDRILADSDVYQKENKQ